MGISCDLVEFVLDRDNPTFDLLVDLIEEVVELLLDTFDGRTRGSFDILHVTEVTERALGAIDCDAEVVELREFAVFGQ